MDIRNFIELQAQASKGATDVDQAVRSSLTALLAEIEKANVTSWLRDTYGLGDEDVLTAGQVEEAMEMFKQDLLRPSEPKGEETKS